jgi:hypothetical protein
VYLVGCTINHEMKNDIELEARSDLAQRPYPRRFNKTFLSTAYGALRNAAYFQRSNWTQYTNTDTSNQLCADPSLHAPEIRASTTTFNAKGSVWA